MDVNYENQLIQDLNDLDSKEKDLISKLASKKAWNKVVESLNENPDLQSHLIAWKQAVRSIPRSRTSPNYRHFRNVANKEMEYCKKSIPCWIMPLYQVVEQFQPEPETFDYIIIDEASQLGPDAIFLFYLAKKVIVVGDDKQTAPEYVGVKDDLVKSLIHKHLKPSANNEIPFSDFYGLKHSFFDHCDRLTGGKRIVLQEHFRCMPEINRHEILEKITPLIENTAMRFGLIPIEIDFEKENHRWFLRIFLFARDRGVTLDDCENVTRSLNDFFPLSFLY
jgi:hypothetical protein